MKPRLQEQCTVQSKQELILASCSVSPMTRNSVFGVSRVKRLAVIQDTGGQKKLSIVSIKVTV